MFGANVAIVITPTFNLMLIDTDRLNRFFRQCHHLSFAGARQSSMCHRHIVCSDTISDIIAVYSGPGPALLEEKLPDGE